MGFIHKWHSVAIYKATSPRKSDTYIQQSIYPSQCTRDCTKDIRLVHQSCRYLTTKLGSERRKVTLLNASSMKHNQKCFFCGG